MTIEVEPAVVFRDPDLDVSAACSSASVFVIAARERLEIARGVRRALGRLGP
jgi:hypothetical protein